MTSESKTRSLRLNTALTAVPQFTSVSLAVLLSPYIVAEVGLTAFGFWSVVLAILSYAQVADGGFPILATRHIAAAKAADDESAVRAATLLACGGLGLLGAAVVFSTALVVLLLPAPMADGLPSGWQAVSLLAALAFALTMFAKGLASVSHGYHRWAVESIVTPASQLVGAAATVALLSSDVGLVGLGIAAVAASLVLVFGFAISAHQLVGLRLQGARPTRGLWRDFRTQGTSLQIVMLVGVTNTQADRLFLLAFAPLSWVGAYALGARLAVALRSFPAAAFGPLTAHLSGLNASQGQDAVRLEYRRALAAVGAFGLSGLVVLYGAMYPGVLAWLGSDYTISATAAALLGVGYAINVLTGPGTGAAVACGMAVLDRNYSLVGLGLNLTLTPILGLAFGPWGVVLATTTGLVVSSVWLLHIVDRWLGGSWWRTLKSAPGAARNIGLSAVFAASAVVGAAYFAPASRLENASVAVGVGLAGACALGLPLMHRREGSRRSPSAA